jgi:hypothetical protein
MIDLDELFCAISGHGTVTVEKTQGSQKQWCVRWQNVILVLTNQLGKSLFSPMGEAALSEVFVRIFFTRRFHIDAGPIISG